MTDASNEPMTSRQLKSILRSLDKMVKKGQMTEAEATRLREATTLQERLNVLLDVDSHIHQVCLILPR
jgi:hypothetical protein